MDKTLYRSRDDRMIAGVAGGIAEYLGIDPTLVRIGIVLLAVVGNFAVVVAYIIMAIVVPEEPVGTAAGSTPFAVGESDAATQAAPTEEREAGMAEDGMGPGDVPEPGEFGRPPVPDPASGRRSEQPVTPPPVQGSPVGPAGGDRGRRDRRGASTAGIILIVIGVVFLLQRFIGLDVWQLWPLILIGIGLWTIFGRGR